MTHTDVTTLAALAFRYSVLTRGIEEDGSAVVAMQKFIEEREEQRARRQEEAAKVFQQIQALSSAAGA